MLALDCDIPGAFLLELLLWGVPVALAALLVRSAPPGRRLTWWIVAAACAVIVVDKLVDLQVLAMTRGKALIRAFAPGMTHGGAHGAARTALLTSLFVLGSAVLWLLARRDCSKGPGKLLALAGLTGVMGLLGARLVPGVGDLLPGSLVELACGALVWAGLLLGLRPSR